MDNNELYRQREILERQRTEAINAVLHSLYVDLFAISKIRENYIFPDQPTGYSLLLILRKSIRSCSMCDKYKEWVRHNRPRAVDGVIIGVNRPYDCRRNLPHPSSFNDNALTINAIQFVSARCYGQSRYTNGDKGIIFSKEEMIEKLKAIIFFNSRVVLNRSELILYGDLLKKTRKEKPDDPIRRSALVLGSYRFYDIPKIAQFL